MSEIVKRVAWAMAKRSVVGEVFSYKGQKPISADEWADMTWPQWGPSARDFIAAMREPTQTMIEACGADDYYNSFDLRRQIWETMIDEALK